MEKMRMESIDMTAQNIEKIEALFPNCITETVGADGKTRKAINFDILRQMLSADVVEGDEAYEFTWVGKKAAIVEANKPIRKTLRPCPEESVDWDTTENLYIEGDNLEVLKLLQESYLGKVKMIYIDPPYNTGNDFVYRDDFAVSSDDYAEQSGQLDEESNRLFKNTDSNGRFHSDWCSMIYSRLMLARNLLSDDGVIFISIDDNEQENLKKICDEVFGTSNFVASFIWRKKSTSTNVMNAQVSALTEYILCFSKSVIQCLNQRVVTTDSRKYPFSDFLGQYRTSIIEKKDAGDYARASMKFPIMGILPREGKRWQIGKEKAVELEKNGRFLNDNGIIKLKIYDFEDHDSYSANPNLLLEYGSTDSANRAINNGLFDTSELFSNPKPTELLKHLCSLGSKKDSIILDFFSGSATTAHAVMQLNVDDGGNRKFIMVQLPELTDEKSEAYKAGYKNICEIGKERIRRAGRKIKEETGADIDYGFRVLKLDEGNMNDVYYSAGEYTQNMLSLLESNVKSDRTDLDLLFGCLLEWGLPLSMPYTSEKIDGFTVHTYNDGDLIACFDENISDTVVKTIAKRQPLRAVFRDSSFPNSPAKINVGEIFKMLAPDTRVKVI